MQNAELFKGVFQNIGESFSPELLNTPIEGVENGNGITNLRRFLEIFTSYSDKKK
jgi:hypothetical protein